MVQPTTIETESRWRRHYHKQDKLVYVNTIILWIASVGFCFLLTPFIQPKSPYGASYLGLLIRPAVSRCLLNSVVMGTAKQLMGSCRLPFLQIKIFLCKPRKLFPKHQDYQSRFTCVKVQRMLIVFQASLQLLQQ
jgi:hypothetical protein